MSRPSIIEDLNLLALAHLLPASALAEPGRVRQTSG